MVDKIHLDSRSEAILNSIIELYVQTAEPVGSRALAKRTGMDLSAATIRNVMADLTEMGLISQPHTSAGRTPTDLAYRYYVDVIRPSTKASRSYIPESAKRDRPDRLEQVLFEVAGELTESTNCAGLILSPQPAASQFKKIDFISLSHTQVLVVLVTQSGMVKNRILQLRESPDQEALTKMSEILMDLFASKTLAEIQKGLMSALTEGETGLSAQAIRLGKKAFSFSPGDEGLLIVGESRLCAYPDFEGAQQLQGIYKVFEEKKALAGIMNEAMSSSGIQVTIGQESQCLELEHCSIVATSYGSLNHRLGSIAVVGPTRIDYPKVMAALDYSSQKLSYAVSHYLDEN